MRTRLATAITTEATIAACMTYVDLHSIPRWHRGIPETSDFTCFTEHFDDLQQAEKTLAEEPKPPSELGARSPDKPLQRTVTTATPQHCAERLEHVPKAGFAAPLQLEPKRKCTRQKHTGRRASDRGRLQISLEDDLMPAEWTVRQAVLGKRRSIPDRIRHLLKRLDLSTERRLQSSIAELSHLQS